MNRLEDGANAFFRIFSNKLQEYPASQPRRPQAKENLRLHTDWGRLREWKWQMKNKF